jgi:hypothetical protein
MSISDNKVRYVVGNGLVQFNMMIHELMLRNNSGETTADKMLTASPVVMNGDLGLMFRRRNSNDVAWLVGAPNAVQWLVWYGNDTVANTLCDEQKNMVPRIDRSCSTTFLHIQKAFEAIEQYVLHGKMPDTVMLPGHLNSLTG